MFRAHASGPSTVNRQVGRRPSRSARSAATRSALSASRPSRTSRCCRSPAASRHRRNAYQAAKNVKMIAVEMLPAFQTASGNVIDGCHKPSVTTVALAQSAKIRLSVSALLCRNVANLFWRDDPHKRSENLNFSSVAQIQLSL